MTETNQQPQHPLITTFLTTSTNPSTVSSQKASHPSYWTPNPSTLLTTSQTHSLSLGTGHRITETLLPALESAQTEVLFVTCYWNTTCATLALLNDSLRKLSAKALARNRNRKIRVRICFSSSGFWQKLFHTRSPKGKVYGPETWSATLGLPSPAELEGLDLEVKSVFFLPISIIHPKFVVVDREKVFLPSCNVSWENWFEGCLELGGEVVGQFVRFWGEFWASELDREGVLGEEGSGFTGLRSDGLRSQLQSSVPSPGLLAHYAFPASAPPPGSIPQQTPTLFLPSPHHTNPLLTLPFTTSPAAPPTPLNTFLLAAFNSAQQTIYIQTPNVTSQPAIEALLAATQRGVSVRIVTSEKLQLLEQIITAGTTSPRCVNKMIARHRALVTAAGASAGEGEGDAERLEAGVKVGRLIVEYYKPTEKWASQAREDSRSDEPVQSHFKLTVIDGEVAVFGSGNMDRPSWFTSQELGVAFFGREFVGECEDTLGRALEGRTKGAYDG